MNANTMNMGPNATPGMADRIEDNVDRAANRTVDTAERTAGRAHDAVNRAADNLAPTLDRVAERAHQTIDSVAERAAPAAQWAQDTARKVTDTTTQYADQWSNYVRQRPLASVGGALAIGYLLGRLMR